MKSKQLILMLVLVLASFSMVTAQDFLPAVWVDLTEIDGLNPDGTIPEGPTTLTIPVHFTNVDDARTAISNGYYFYSDNGVTCTVDTALWNPAYPWNNFLAYTVHMCYPPVCYAWFDQGDWWTRMPNGLGGFGIAALTGGNGDGLPPDFDDVAYSFTLTNVTAPPGGVLVMDTSYWEPGNFWLWNGVGDQVCWDGPYNIGDPFTDVAFENGAEIPNGFALNQNYPNPFNPSTTLDFDVPRRAHVNVVIYNILGQPVKTLVDEEMAPNSYSVEWNGTTDAGTQVSSGVYLCSMKAGEFNRNIKMMLLR